MWPKNSISVARL